MYLQMSFDVVCLRIELADLQYFTSIAFNWSQNALCYCVVISSFK